MRFLERSTAAFAALTLGLGLIACGDDPPAAPEGLSASAAQSGAAATTAKIDPLVTKSYRVDACYYGAIALKQGRDAYLASLGGAEPSKDKVPDFGSDPDDPAAKSPPPGPAPSAAPPGGSATPTATAKATAAPTAKATATPTAKATATAKATGTAVATAKPTGSATAVASAPPGEPPTPARMKQGLKFTQFVRHCNTALSVRDVPNAELDAALKDFYEYAQPLAKVMDGASDYYSLGKFSEDEMKQGATYHACLTGTGTCEVKDKAQQKTVTNAFAQLDEKIAKMQAAVDKFHGASPVNKANYEESQKAADKAVTDASAVIAILDKKPVDTGKLKEAVTTLEASTNALKAFGENKEKPDLWSKNLGPMLTQFATDAKTLSEKPADQIIPAKIYKLVLAHGRILDKNYTTAQSKLREGQGPRVGAPGARQKGPKVPPIAPGPKK